MKKILATLFVSIFLIFWLKAYADTYNNENFDDVKKRWDIEVTKYEDLTYDELAKEFISESPEFQKDYLELIDIFKMIDQGYIDSINE